MTELRLVLAQKLAPARRIEKEIAGLDHRTGSRAHGLGLSNRAGLRINLPAGLFVHRTRSQAQAGHGGDRRQGLAPEPHGVQGKQIVGALDFAGGVALQAEEGVVLLHAVAVVGDPHQALAALFDLDKDFRCRGVQGVFHQFLDHGCRAFDNFSGGDLVGKVFREDLNSGRHNSKR